MESAKTNRSDADANAEAAAPTWRETAAKVAWIGGAVLVGAAFAVAAPELALITGGTALIESAPSLIQYARKQYAGAEPQGEAATAEVASAEAAEMQGAPVASEQIAAEMPSA